MTRVLTSAAGPLHLLNDAHYKTNGGTVSHVDEDGEEGNKRTGKEQRSGRERELHRQPPLIVSERKLNIDQSEWRETMERGETEPGYK